MIQDILFLFAATLLNELSDKSSALPTFSYSAIILYMTFGTVPTLIGCYLVLGFNVKNTESFKFVAITIKNVFLFM